MRKLTKEEFEKRVADVSNDTIDVSNFEFENTQKSGLCRCKICGNEWYAKAYSILQGHGCRKCYDKKNSERKKIDVKEVQNRLNKNNTKYKIIGEYVDTKHKCDVMCENCGNVWSVAVGDLLRGHGCPKCGREKQRQNISLTEEEYKERCKRVYNELYDLSELKYHSMGDSVYPICKKHGSFSINASYFLKGNGCPFCRKEKNNEHVREKNYLQFIERAKKIHNDKYDYRCVKYSNTNSNVDIICPIHGVFSMTPHHHLSGEGCPKCKSSHMEINIRTLLQENNICFIEQKKFDWMGLQSLDFYLPKYNVGIECQGKQHFESVEVFGGNDALKENIERDRRKRNLCIENGISLIYYINKKHEVYMEEEFIYFVEKEKLLEYLENKTKCSII